MKEILAIDAFKLTEVSATERGFAIGGQITQSHPVVNNHDIDTDSICRKYGVDPDQKVETGQKFKNHVPRFRIQWVTETLLTGRIASHRLVPINDSARELIYFGELKLSEAQKLEFSEQRSIGYPYNEKELHFKPRFRIDWIREQTPLKDVIVGSRLTPLNELAEELEDAMIEADEARYWLSFT